MSYRTWITNQLKCKHFNSKNNIKSFFVNFPNTSDLDEGSSNNLIIVKLGVTKIHYKKHTNCKIIFPLLLWGSVFLLAEVLMTNIHTKLLAVNDGKQLNNLIMIQIHSQLRFHHSNEKSTQMLVGGDFYALEKLTFRLVLSWKVLSSHDTRLSNENKNLMVV